MSGSELKLKMESAGYTQAELARLLGVAPQSITQYYNADDVKSGLLERICQVIGKDMSFFYDNCQQSKESEVYRLWMEHMRITEKMQELYQKEKEG